MSDGSQDKVGDLGSQPWFPLGGEESTGCVFLAGSYFYLVNLEYRSQVVRVKGTGNPILRFDPARSSVKVPASSSLLPPLAILLQRVGASCYQGRNREDPEGPQSRPWHLIPHEALLRKTG